MNKEQTVRLSNFELMRIIAIISILINHYVVLGLGEMSLTQSNLYVISSHFLAAFAVIFDVLKNKIFINKLNTLVNNSKLIKYLDNILFSEKKIKKVIK